MAYLVEPLVTQMQEVLSAPPSPMDKQHFPKMDLEATMASHHPTLAPLVELETSALSTGVPAWEEQVPSRDKEPQAVFQDKVLDLRAPAWDLEADLHLSALGLDKLPEATALAHQAHKDLS